MKYLELLRAVDEISDTPDGLLPKLPKAPDSISDAPDRVLPKPPKALATLHAIHANHMDNLRAAGIDGIARVLLTDWRAATGLDEFTFWRTVIDLEQTGQIIREHGYARPNDNGLPA